MSAHVDRIATVLRAQIDYRAWDCTTPEHVAEQIAEVTQPTLTTQEQLDALPHLSLVLYPYVSRAGWKLHQVWERRNESWYCLAAPTNPPGHEFGYPSLPALLLWTPVAPEADAS